MLPSDACRRYEAKEHVAFKGRLCCALAITERGYHDDAVEGVVMRYRLEQSSDGWRITRAEGKELRRPGY